MRTPASSRLSFNNSARSARDVYPANGVVHRPLALLALVVCLPALIPQRASEASNFITERTGQSSRAAYFGFEIGPTFSLPLPVGSVSRDEVGLETGLNCTVRTTPMLGIGPDFEYFYWPVSAEFKQQFNQLLASETFNTLKLGGDRWDLRVLRVGGHVQVSGPSTRVVRPWIQVGGGVCRVDPNTSGFGGNAGFFTVTAPPLPKTLHFGSMIAIGADLFRQSHVRVGLGATYYVVDCSEPYGQNLRALSLGARTVLAW
jgi:hypothetical protein